MSDYRSYTNDIFSDDESEVQWPAKYSNGLYLGASPAKRKKNRSTAENHQAEGMHRYHKLQQYDNNYRDVIVLPKESRNKFPVRPPQIRRRINDESELAKPAKHCNGLNLGAARKIARSTVTNYESEGMYKYQKLSQYDDNYRDGVLHEGYEIRAGGKKFVAKHPSIIRRMNERDQISNKIKPVGLRKRRSLCRRMFSRIFVHFKLKRMMELVRSHRIKLLYQKLCSFVSRLFDRDGYNQIRKRKTRQGGGYHLRRMKAKPILMAKRRWHIRDEVERLKHYTLSLIPRPKVLNSQN